MRNHQLALWYILRLNIGFELFNSYATARSDKVRLTPESCISIVGIDLFTKFFAVKATGDSFQVIDERGLAGA